MMENKVVSVAPEKINPAEKGNNLFPVFLKLENLRLLIVGGGNVGTEKLQAVIQNAPATLVHLVALNVHEKIYEIAKEHSNVLIEQKPYSLIDLDDADLVIVAVNNIETSKQIRNDAHAKGLLVNVADKPELCDFYLSSVVKKGSVKIAISTNGKSPTIAKRLKEIIDNMIPDEMEDVLENMQTIRQGLNVDFDEKVKQLNDITKVLVAKQTGLPQTSIPGTKKWQSVVKWSLLAFIFMIIGHTVLSFVPFENIILMIK